jgi:trigger factor
MQVSVENVSTLERRVSISVPSSDIDEAVEKKLLETARRVRIDGFRPGKVPLSEVRKRFARGMREEVLGDVVNKSFYDAIVTEKLSPAGAPQIAFTTNESGKDLEFTATFEVYPAISVNGIQDISVVRPQAEIAESDLEAMVNRLREQKATFTAKDGAAETGNQVTIDFEGRVDGEVFEGGTAKDQKLVLGSGSMIPGFEDGILGMAAGQTREVSVTFPDTYHAEQLKGKAAVFTVTVHNVETRQLPEVNEEFVRFFGIGDGSMEAFRTEITRNMGRELKNATRNKVKQQVFDGLLASNDFDVPKVMVNAEVDRMRQQMMQQFGGRGAKFDSSMLPADLFLDKAGRNVRLGLILGEIIREHDIKSDAARVRSTIEEMAESFEQPQDVVNWYYQNEQQLKQIEAGVLEDQVVELVLSQAKVEDRVMSYQDAVKPLESAEG